VPLEHEHGVADGHRERPAGERRGGAHRRRGDEDGAQRERHRRRRVAARERRRVELAPRPRDHARLGERVLEDLGRRAGDRHQRDHGQPPPGPALRERHGHTRQPRARVRDRVGEVRDQLERGRDARPVQRDEAVQHGGVAHPDRGHGEGEHGDERQAQEADQRREQRGGAATKHSPQGTGRR
jgi:hypothetical protein